MNESRRTRDLVAKIAAVVAVVALPLGMLSIWVTAYVSDTHRYVATVRPLAHDPAVQRAAEDYLTAESVKAVESSADLGKTLAGLDLSCLGGNTTLLTTALQFAGGFLGGDSSTLSGAVMDALRPYLEGGIHRAIVDAVEGPHFEQVWVAANRKAHTEVLAVLENKQPSGAGNKILIPLTQIADSLATSFGCKNLIPTSASGLEPAFTLVNADDLHGARTGYQVVHPLRIVLPIVFVVALALALGLSTSRRHTGLVLAVGFLAGAGVVEVALLVTKSLITSDDANKAIVDAIWGALTHTLDVALIVVAVASALTAIALWVLGSTRPPPDAPDAPAPDWTQPY